jgi:hypothetical protein
MTVALGVMSVPAPVDGDSIRRYETGTLPDGGLWTALRRLSDHNHTGGVNGAPISVASIPPGSITVDKLDPAVLLPYALVDGSKPFTGQVAMNSDAIIRDHLYFGAKPAGVADATLQRTGAGALRVDGTRASLAMWSTGSPSPARIGQIAGGERLDLTSNIWHDGTNWVRDATGSPAAMLTIGGGQITMNSAPAGANPVSLGVERFKLAPTGTLTLSPDGGQAAIRSATNNLDLGAGGSGVGVVYLRPHQDMSSNWAVQANNAWGFGPTLDNQAYCGHPSTRWVLVAAVAGAINTSSRDAKEGITPLDPARAMQAVRDTPAVTFDYVAPRRGPEWYDLPEDPEQAEAVLQQRLTAAPLVAAALHQHGFIAEDCDPLFLVGEGQTSPGSSIGVLLAALQQLDQRVQSLEGAA